MFKLKKNFKNNVEQLQQDSNEKSEELNMFKLKKKVKELELKVEQLQQDLEMNNTKLPILEYYNKTSIDDAYNKIINLLPALLDRRKNKCIIDIKNKCIILIMYNASKNKNVIYNLMVPDISYSDTLYDIEINKDNIDNNTLILKYTSKSTSTVTLPNISKMQIKYTVSPYNDATMLIEYNKLKESNSIEDFSCDEVFDISEYCIGLDKNKVAEIISSIRC